MPVNYSKKVLLNFSFCDCTLQELDGIRLLHLRVDPGSNPGHPDLLCSLHGSPGINVIKLLRP